MPHQQGTLGGRPQAPGVAFEQCRAGILFQFLEPFRQARLSGVGLSCGVAQAAGLGQVHQQLQVARAQAAGPVHGEISHMFFGMALSENIIFTVCGAGV
ncbi:hypothetical protein D9M68_763940 [compost metagenome]